MRNRVLLAALGTHFEVTAFTPDARSTAGRIVSGLVKFMARQPQRDICLAGFYGQPLAIALAVLQRSPILLDAYVSTYDTLCYDRRRFGPRSLRGRLAWGLDSRSFRSSTHIMTDTDANGEYIARTFDIPRKKISTVYVGCDETLFYPRRKARTDERRFEVFYYGSFLRLHGVDVIVEAAALLRDRPEIHFTLGGDGECRRDIEGKIRRLALTNVDMPGWIPLRQVPEYINRASICVGGHFSTVPKAARVVSTKTFQFVAMQKATIVGDNAATREIFEPGKHVLATPMGNPEALADAICTLVDNPTLRRRIALGGYEIFEQRLSTQRIATQLVAIVEDISCASAC